MVYAKRVPQFAALLEIQISFTGIGGFAGWYAITVLGQKSIRMNHKPVITNVFATVGIRIVVMGEVAQGWGIGLRANRYLQNLIRQHTIHCLNI
jgi:hypothetical protein